MMKKITVILIMLICSMALTACLQQATEPLNTNDIVAGIINNTSPKESSVEQNPDITAEDSHLCSSNDNVDASGGGPEDFQRYYPDELFSLYNLSKLVTWDEIYAAEKTLLENNEYFYNEQLPPLYLMIKELGVTKEEFIRVNDQLNDEQIEVLFSNKKNETIQRELKLDTAFFYKGRLYNIYELSALEPIQLKEMVDEGNMIDYLNVLESINAGKGNDSEILNDYIDFIKNKIDK
ncbi:MAG: hypothetical protein IJE43_04595 [Alphaproteobacteria bacterium]|nr:hypothetical protein [Alphaproteobacteria bacterium]